MSARIDVVDAGVVRIVHPGRVAHTYVLLGKRLALVDCGGESSEQFLLTALATLDVPRQKVSLIVLTHEHASHAGAAHAFPDALLAAHPLAAAKLRHGDSARTKVVNARTPDLELAAGSAIHLGGFSFGVLHTPGHTSGSICLYERARGLLVTGDTVFGRETLPLTSASGSRGEHLESLERLASLRARMLLPGHGAPSDDPSADIASAAGALRASLEREDVELRVS